MKTRHLLVLAIVFLALLGLVKGLEYLNRDTGVAKVDDFIAIDIDRLDKVEITSGEDLHQMTKQNGVWSLTSPINYQLDELSFTALLDKLQDFKVTNLISESPDKREIFQVDETNGIKVVLYYGDQIASTFWVGKLSPDGNHTYVREADADQIYTARGSLKALFGKSTVAWRDKTIYQVEQSGLARIFVTPGGGEQFIISPASDGSWELETTEQAQEQDQTALQTFINSLLYLTATGFVDDVQIREGINFSEPWVEFSLEQTTGGILKLTVAEQEGKYYVKQEGNDQIFEIASYSAGNLKKTPADFLIAVQPAE